VDLDILELVFKHGGSLKPFSDRENILFQICLRRFFTTADVFATWFREKGKTPRIKVAQSILEHIYF